MNEQPKIDKLQKKVEKAADRLFKLLPNENQNPKLLLLHFLSGPFSEPYALRRTAIRSKNSELARLVERYSSIEQNRRHSEALSRYIRHFNRRYTFLHMVIDEYKKNKDEQDQYRDGLLGTLIVEEDEEKNGDSDYICDQEKGEKSGEIIWRFNNNTVKTLIPGENIDFAVDSENSKKHSTVKKFMTLFIQDLYKDNWEDRSRDQWRGLFEHSLQEIFGILISKEENRWDNRFFDEEINFRSKYKERLAAYQSGILYFIKSLEKEDTNEDSLSCSVVLYPSFSNKTSKDITEDTILNLAIVIITPKISNNSIVPSIKDELKYFLDELPIDGIEKDSDIAVTPLNTLINQNVEEEKKETFLDDFQEKVSKAFNKLKPFKKSYELFTYWLLFLIQKLQNKVHEGNRLVFYLVCGDKSQFEDAQSAEIRELSLDKDIKPLEIPESKKESIIRNRAEKNVELLSK